MRPEVIPAGRGPERPRSQAKRERIVAAALAEFARSGYHAARVESIAAALGIAKGSVFQHFGSKAGLFLEAYKKAVQTLPAYHHAPPDVLERGFFATLRYWLDRTEHLLREDWIPYRVALLGNHETELSLRHEINRFLAARDPYGTARFVNWGRERGEVREDVEPAMLASILDWTVERFQDALLTEELDPGLFPRPGTPAAVKAARIDQFLEVLRSAMGAPRHRAPAAKPRAATTRRRAARPARRRSSAS